MAEFVTPSLRRHVPKFAMYAAPKQMNRIDEIVKRDVDITTYRIGLSTRHAWIKSLEYLLHISFGLEIKKNGKHEKTNER
jgi:hypothetical protein